MKTLRPFVLFTFLTLILFLFWSFQEVPKPKEELDKDTRIRLAVEEKLAARKKRRMDHCREVALKKAEEMVDSILLAQAKLTVPDTISKPLKPAKPELLEVKKAKDQTPIKPLFDEKAIEVKSPTVENLDTVKLSGIREKQ